MDGKAAGRCSIGLDCLLKSVFARVLSCIESTLDRHQLRRPSSRSPDNSISELQITDFRHPHTI